MENDELRTRGPCDPGRVVEHPARHPLLLVTLEVAHEARDRRVHGEHDLGLLRELAEARGPRVVHPEAALEVDLAGGETPALEHRDRLLRAPAGRDARRAETQLRHGSSLVRPTLQLRWPHGQAPISHRPTGA